MPALPRCLGAGQGKSHDIIMLISYFFRLVLPGEIVDDGGFTLTRALKRAAKKAVATPTGTSGSPRHAPSGAEEQSIPLTSRETSSTQDSGTSKESMTDV